MSKTGQNSEQSTNRSGWGFLPFKLPYVAFSASANSTAATVSTEEYKPPQSFLGMNFPATRQQAAKYSCTANNDAAFATLLGFTLSGANGIFRLIHPINTPVLAGRFTQGSRIFYCSSATIRSSLRFWTTNPEARTDLRARALTYGSDAFSLLSLGTAAHFFASLHKKMPPKIKAFANFNIPAAFGIIAAGLYIQGEYLETNTRIKQIAEELAKQKGISFEEAERIARGTVPHMTKSEYRWKAGFVYPVCLTAALGGVAGILPDVGKHYPGFYNNIAKITGHSFLKAAPRIGGMVNGVGYCLPWLVSAAFCKWRYYTDIEKGEERNIPRRYAQTVADIQQQGKIELASAVGFIAAAAVAMRYGKSNPAELAKVFGNTNSGILDKIKAHWNYNLPAIGEMMLNKADVSVLGFWGVWAILNNINQSPGESLALTASYLRSFYAGPRLGSMRDADDYLKIASLPENEREAALRKFAIRTIGHKGLEQDLSKMPIAKLQTLLENARYVKSIEDGTLIRRMVTVKPEPDADPDRRPLSSAKYVREMQDKADVLLEQNAAAQPGTRTSKEIDIHHAHAIHHPHDDVYFAKHITIRQTDNISAEQQTINNGQISTRNLPLSSDTAHPTILSNDCDYIIYGFKDRVKPGMSQSRK